MRIVTYDGESVVATGDNVTKADIIVVDGDGDECTVTVVESDDGFTLEIPGVDGLGSKEIARLSLFKAKTETDDA